MHDHTGFETGILTLKVLQKITVDDKFNFCHCFKKSLYISCEIQMKYQALFSLNIKEDVAKICSRCFISLNENMLESIIYLHEFKAHWEIAWSVSMPKVSVSC